MLNLYCGQHPEYKPIKEFFPIHPPKNDCGSCELFFVLTFKDAKRLKLTDEDFVSGIPSLKAFCAKLNKKQLEKAIAGLETTSMGTL